MSNASEAERAERLSKRRIRTLPVLAVLVMGQQAIYLADRGGGQRSVDRLHISAWLVMSVVILAAMTTGGGWIYSRKVRQLANDETTRVHRDRAFRAGFLASMGCCIVLYFASTLAPLSGREAIHLVMSVGIVVTLLWFAFLERRAHRDG